MNINGTGQGSYLDTGVDGEPALSSDASIIAYSANSNEQYDLYFYNIRNQQHLQLSLPNTDEFYPQWSADDSQILYYSFDQANDLGSIYILEPETCVEQNNQLFNCESRLVLDNEGQYADSWATWALDDTAVLFQSNRWDLNRHIFMMNADGSGELRQITFGQNSQERFPRWRP
jgi:Tol biopolymer transport system component